MMLKTTHPPQHTAIRTAIQPTNQRLLIIRRLDWRFLLPTPELGRIAFLGSVEADPSLLVALQTFSQSLDILSASHTPLPTDPGYDLVVVRQPYAGPLHQVREWIRPAGHLYIEAWGVIHPRGWRNVLHTRSLHGRPRLPADYYRQLYPLGFRHIRCFAHWPNFQAGTRIIPLDSPVVWPYVLRQKGLLAALIRLAFTRKWHHALVPHFSIIAQKGTP